MQQSGVRYYSVGLVVIKTISKVYEAEADLSTTFSTEIIEQHPLLPAPPKPDYAQCKLLRNENKFDCFPENGVTQESCEARGCCWIPAKTKPKSLFCLQGKLLKKSLYCNF